MHCATHPAAPHADLHAIMQPGGKRRQHQRQSSTRSAANTSTDASTETSGNPGRGTSARSAAGLNAGSGTGASTNTSVESATRLHVENAIQWPNNVACDRARQRHRFVPRLHHAIPRTHLREMILRADAPWRGHPGLPDHQRLRENKHHLFGFPSENGQCQCQFHLPSSSHRRH